MFTKQRESGGDSAGRERKGEVRLESVPGCRDEKRGSKIFKSPLEGERISLAFSGASAPD